MRRFKLPPEPGGRAAALSFASSAQTRAGRLMIRLIENGSGRRALMRRLRGAERQIAAGQCFWAVMAARFGITLEIAGGALGNIPRRGPVIVVANHPFGILDGLMLGHLLSQRRDDFRVLANDVFRGRDEVDRVVLPISFARSRAAAGMNLQTRQRALHHLAQGGAIGVFPGGTVSTVATPFARTALDPRWRSFTARMVEQSDAVVLPVFFAGQNARLFQLASHMHPVLRLGLLMRQFHRRCDAPVQIVIGAPIAPGTLAAFRGERRAMMDFLRRATYQLSREPLPELGYGFDFEERRRA